MPVTKQRQPTVPTDRADARSRPRNWPDAGTGERNRPHRPTPPSQGVLPSNERAGGSGRTKTVRILDTRSSYPTRRLLAVLLAGAAGIAALGGAAGNGAGSPSPDAEVRAEEPAAAETPVAPAPVTGDCQTGAATAPLGWLPCWSDLRQDP